MKKKRKLEDCTFGFLVISVHILAAWSASHRHLGCYMDTTADPDLPDQSKTLDPATLTDCVTYCAEAGLAYAGFKNGRVCSCSNLYGRHGVPTTPNACNFTCEENSVLCGGPSANDIYYAVDSDILMRARREFTAYTDPMSYPEARKRCVIANGDLVTMRDPSYFNNLQTIATDAQITSEFVWIGLFWNKNNKYIWADASIVGLSSSLTSPYWRSGETNSHECVRLSVSGKDWSTASCSSQYPFICHQLPANPDVTTSPDGTEYTEEEEQLSFFQDRQKVTFYLVLPLFVLCYGGSCLMYAISRCWRYFKKRKRQQARDSMLIASPEYDPDTKPQSESRPLTSRDVKVEDDQFTPPPPYYRVNSRATSRADRPIQTPVKKFRTHLKVE